MSLLVRPARSLLLRSTTRYSVAHHHQHLSIRSFRSCLPRFEQPPQPPSSLPKVDTTGTKTPIGRIQRRLQITFTCTATLPSTRAAAGEAEQEGQDQPCHHRSTHEFSRTSYEKGIVLIECPGCGNRHLIGKCPSFSARHRRNLTLTHVTLHYTADNLQWFSSTPSPSHPSGLPIGSVEERQPRTVEQLMKEKGEQVVWVDGGKEGGTWMVEG